MKHSGFTLSLVVLLFACAVLLTSKAGSRVLIALIERPPDSTLAPAGEEAQAIVVLTGGDSRTWEAARRYRETGLPVLSSGGDGEATLLKQDLQNKFDVPVRWTEERSLNTEENAFFSAEILAGENIQNIILITDALHMWRAKMMFSDRGLKVIAAPTNYLIRTRLQAADFLPSKEGFKLTKSAMHEIFGVAWYWGRKIRLLT